MIRLQVRRFLGPAKCRECPQPRREPRVEGVFVLDPTVSGGVELDFDFFNPSTLARDSVRLAVSVSRTEPSGNAMAEPNLTRDAPVAEVVYPVVVDLLKAF